MSTYHKNKNNQGFTLIEILVVVAIIGMIAGVVMVSLSSARAKGRDAKRKADLVQLQKALELFQNTNSQYPKTFEPNASPIFWGISNNGQNKALTGANGYIPDLAPTFVSNLPVDPLNRTDLWSGYLYASDGVSYKLLSHFTGPESLPSVGEPFYDPTRYDRAWMVCFGSSACDTW